MKNGRLTAKQDRFCREYVVDLNASGAARKAGYKARTARQQGQRLLTKVHVQQRIAELQAEVAHRLGIEAENVLQELARVGFSRIDDYLEFDDNGVTLKSSKDLLPEQLSAISEMREIIGQGGNKTLRLKLHDKLAALDKLGKHFGLFNESTTQEAGDSLFMMIHKMRLKAEAENNQQE